MVDAVATEPILPTLTVPAEGMGEAFLMRGPFALVAFGSPLGRSSTAQGIFGAVGTIGLIVATITAGILWELGRSWPFGLFVVGAASALALGVLAYRLGRVHMLRPLAVSR